VAANLTNLHTKRAYEDAVGDFVRFTGIAQPEEFRTVTRAHVIAWRDDLKTRLTKRGEPWNDSSIRHRLAALASLFQYLCPRQSGRRAVLTYACVGLWTRRRRVEEGGHKASRLLDPGLCIIFGFEAADLVQRIMRRPKIDCETAWPPINIKLISRSGCIFVRHGISLGCDFRQTADVAMPDGLFLVRR
jgi:hypothetical protein